MGMQEGLRSENNMDFKKRAKELVEKMTLAEKVAQMQFESPAIERLGVKAYNWWNEALHGSARNGTATVFPQSIAMAASFNDELMYDVAVAISDEVRAKYNEYVKFGDTEIYQGLTCWSPNINIFRDPRWGRGHETYGEDPLLTGKMAVAFVNGMQGDDKTYKKVDATLKHYAVHSGPEEIRHGFDAIVSQKDLYETYLFAFKYCIERTDVSAVMCAYNRVNGEPACASKTLLDDILRDEFGFKGYVVSDCGAICDINKYHRVTENEAESAALAVKGGCDLNCGDAYKWLKTAVASGLLSEEDVNKSVERLFEARFRLGMFDDDCKYNQIPYDIVACEDHQKLNLEMARQSIVMLENKGILPLDKKTKVAVIGPNADDLSVLLANYNGTPDKYYTFLRGIQEESEERVIYARGSHIHNDDTVERYSEHPLREAVIAAKKADVAILFLGLNPSIESEESLTRGIKGDKEDIEIPFVQKRLYEEVKSVGKPLIVVNVSGSCVDLSFAQDADALLQIFYPGAKGGKALAEILYGKISPSGRLPLTFYKDTLDLPPFEDYSMENRTYKFFKGKALYEFGYGLTYGQVEEEWLDDKTVVIKNKSNWQQDYSVLRFQHDPHKELKDFKKIKLAPNSETKLVFEE